MNSFDRILAPLHSAPLLTAINDPETRKALSNVRRTFARFDANMEKLEAIVSERTTGRVPSQDVDCNAPGYTPGLSKEVMK
jgi:hypothetical protein